MTQDILVAKASHFSASRYSRGCEDVADAFAAGANYQIWAGMQGELDPNTGMVLEINRLKAPLEAFCQKTLDHRCFELCYNKRWRAKDLFGFVFDGLSSRFNEDQLRLSYLRLDELPRLSMTQGEQKGFRETLTLSFDAFAAYLGEASVFLDATLLFDAARFKRIDPAIKQALFNALTLFFKTGQVESLLSLSESSAFVGIKCASYSLTFSDGALMLSWPMPFSFQHQLVLDSLSKVENEALFGPCERIHGHSMVLWPKMRLPIKEHGLLWQKKSDLSVGIQPFLDTLQEEGAHQRLCETTGYPIPSCEVLLSYLKAELTNVNISKEALLESLSLFETPRNLFKIKV